MRGRVKNWLYVGGLVGIVGSFGALPWYFSRSLQKQGKNLMMSDEPLGGHQIMRGAYMNTGSHDAGVDTNWRRDPVTGKLAYHGESNRPVTAEQAEAFRKEREAS